MHKIYLTTPIYYVNASPHIGHAYTNVIADCLARYRRLLWGKEAVFFLTGTDEHGEKIERAAKKNNEDPKVFVDRVSANFKKLWEKLDVEYDCFIRTTDQQHTRAVQKAISALKKKGDIYKSIYHGFFCIPCESFWSQGQLDPGGGCPDCGRKVEEIKEENYFFKAARYQKWLMGYFKENPHAVEPKIRYNEVMGFLENNTLQDLCVSRPRERVSWGISFPDDPEYVVYVWFDALINYISAVKYDVDDAVFKKWWPADIHFIGKDILRQHAVIWPIMLKALDISLPGTVFAHGWWKIGKEKMSKSLGNIVNPLTLLEAIGVDALRYFLLREVSVGMDGNYSWPLIVNRINSDLANDLGNLVFRVLNMADKYFEGVIEPAPDGFLPSSFQEYASGDTLLNVYISHMDKIEFSAALECVWRFISTMNKYIEDTKPWVLKKEGNMQALNGFLWSLLEGIRIVAVFIFPFMPRTASAIYRQLGLTFENVQGLVEAARWDTGTRFSVHKGDPLFPRIDVD